MENLRDIIKFTRLYDVITVVSARKLHYYLEVKMTFKEFVDEYIKPLDMDKSLKVDPTIDYELTIQFAKSLSLIINTDKSKEIYKLLCEY